MARSKKTAALALTTALGALAITGCSAQGAPRADLSANKAQVALEKGQSGKAIANAEAAVLAEPQNAAYRGVLGAAYLDAGRFQSAATSFDDAMKLGDTSGRTALGFALASIGKGDNARAVAVLDDWRDDIPASDLGLALALAGEADRGVHVLGNALRGGENTAKLRQNLAYAYALQGNWKAARIMAAEDVAPVELDQRISDWARSAKPEDFQQRVAGLLNVPVRADAGQPVQLALSSNPNAQQLAAEAAASAPQVARAPAAGELPPVAEFAAAAPAPRELPPLDSVPVGTAPAKPTPQVAVAAPNVKSPESFEDAFKAPAPSGVTVAQVAASAIKFVSSPVVQAMPARQGATPKPARVAKRNVSADGSHLVQLGSFRSEAGARRAWGIYAKRYPNLSDYNMVITQAKVRGKTYYRVNAGGFQQASAKSMCGTVKSRGQGCIAWAEGRPLPGAVDRGVRMARR
ncbi:SPOR domain-containing protein [Parerythrobacter jejuensis]|uniref:SPOR domain-containing protein n=1 Tax=Parerythrobacter jejuensis TaxID=795812 RepID=A0A845ARH3_9SPHN|nr:SPOR domain-containing protein [Parerythrobacter jejuensis]MXP31505.1 SPOR domain-containing protein [Parerythrobacter jejuensis]